MPEPRQLTQHNDKHLLHKVIPVRRLNAERAQPTVDQRRIEIDKPLPGFVVGSQLRATKQAQ
jgi:hypothetical protein